MFDVYTPIEDKVYTLEKEQNEKFSFYQYYPLYDPSSMRKKKLTNPPFKSKSIEDMFNYGTLKILVVLSTQYTTIKNYNKVFIFDFAMQVWTEGPRLNKYRTCIEGCCLGTKAFVFGGSNNYMYHQSSVEFLDFRG